MLGNLFWWSFSLERGCEAERCTRSLVLYSRGSFEIVWRLTQVEQGRIPLELTWCPRISVPELSRRDVGASTSIDSHNPESMLSLNHLVEVNIPTEQHVRVTEDREILPPRKSSP